MRRSWSPVLWFFVLTYAVTGVAVWVHLYAAHRLPIMTWLPYAPYVLGTGPSLVGLMMTLFLDGLTGVKRIVLQFNPWSVGRAWPVLAICLLLPLGVAQLLVALGVAVPPVPGGGWADYLRGALIGQGLIGAGLFEEIGWRGFALPRLQRRCSALMSSLIIGLAWAFWHFPNLFIFQSLISWAQVAAYVPYVMALSVVFTWIYNSTGGSLFAVVLLHGAIDTSWSLFASVESPLQTATAGLLYAVIAGGLVWRYGAANLSWRDLTATGPPSPALHQKPASPISGGS